MTQSRRVLFKGLLHRSRHGGAHRVSQLAVTRHALRFWFYLSPALYSVDQVAQIAGKNRLIHLWFVINPFTYILGGYRDLIYSGTAPDWKALGVVGIVSVGLVALAILLFKRAEPQFAKVL